MSSPFQTLDEFKQAADGPTEGAIYTFANNPGIIGIALLVSVLPLLWFIYASYTIKPDRPETHTSVNLSVLIVAGLVSLFGSLNHSDSQAAREAALKRGTGTTVSTNHRPLTPIALLGLAGGALPLFRRSRKKPQRSRLRRSSRTPRS